MEHELPSERLRPVVLDAVIPRMPRLESAYPVYVALGDAPPRPLAQVLGEHEGTAAIVADVIAAMGDRPLVPPSELRERLTNAPNQPAFPSEGWLVGFRGQALPLLYGAFLASSRRAARSKFSLELRHCVAGLQDLLAVDRAKSLPVSDEVTAASLGPAGQRYLAISSLNQAWQRRGHAPSPMDPGRRARCEATLAILEQALERQDLEPAFRLFHSGEALPDLAAVNGQSHPSTDPCASAMEFCDRQLADFIPVLRAMRVARLELESSFDPAHHPEMLDRFDWQTAGPDELAALAVVAVMEPAERIAELTLTSFSRLLRSGLPVQILVPSCGIYADDLCGSAPDLGHLAIAHRDAFVLQSSLAAWDHLANGFAELTATLRPAVAIVATPEDGQNTSEAWLETSLHYLSRTFPLFRYDPDRGAGWAERFHLFEPGPPYDAMIPLHSMALSSQYREDFRILPPSAWDEDQMEICEYLAKYIQTAPLAIPFLWIFDRDGNRQRAVLTRELIHLCRDRQQAWDLFAGLAPRRESQSPIANSSHSGAEMEEARQQGATQAYQRLFALLADPDIIGG
jgi:hypothetical protein